jgi:hypothetical protein
VNRQHLAAFFWLRWRLFVNKLKRGGIANVVILSILAAFGIVFAFLAFLGLFLAGFFAMPKAPPVGHLITWDVFILLFLFWWGIGVLVDLQRSESLSLDKFLHLPVSLSSAFFINYLGSLLSLTTVILVPAIVGLVLGWVLATGPLPLLLLPAVAAFLFMVTALTYQFQGWLASLMANKRRRQTIIVMISVSMVLLCQLPNALNLLRPWKKDGPDELKVELEKDQAELWRSLQAGTINRKQYEAQLRELIEANAEQRKKRDQETDQMWEEGSRIGNLVLPPGWLALGAEGLAEGNVLPALFGTLGLGLIGSASLWRAYRTTIRYYTGQISAGKKPGAAKQPAVASVPALPTGVAPVRFMEKRIPGLSEPAVAIALATFRSLLRAPEAKMLLLSPFIMVIIFGSMLLTRTFDPPDDLRPFLPFGAMAMVLFGIIALVGNQFGFDRNGFRIYVLGPARRQDILLGKNLAAAPIALVLGAILMVFLAALYPMRVDHVLTAPFQMLSMFLLFCFTANWLSIFAAVAMPVGGLKAAKPRNMFPVLLNLAFIFLFPLALVPALAPLGVELGLQQLGVMEGWPVALVLTLLECAGVVYLYRLALTWQGAVLQWREQKILEAVTVRSE